MSQDILFDIEDGLFSYRVAGVLIRDNKVLFQQADNEPGYAIPGGHVNFGELSKNALIREFKEETNIDIYVVRMLWISEIFYPWGEKNCHQICLYYLIEANGDIDTTAAFDKIDDVDEKFSHVTFKWVNIDDFDEIEIYPAQAKDYLKNISTQIKHFIYTEQN